MSLQQSGSHLGDGQANMSVDDKFLYESLLRYNYLPMQRKRKEELPPVFDSTTFTPDAAKPLLGMKPDSSSKGFDVVEYKTTKFNNVSRSFSIPHPVGYVQLAECIRQNWQAISQFQNSSVSMIRPRQHSDGRVIVMDYESFAGRAQRVRDLAFGNRYTVRTDITNCFPSMYTHAIPWAVVGVAEAKKKTTGGWHNELDRFARRTVRDETQGLPVGPATSNIIAELMLGKVDSELSDEFHFERDTDEAGLSRFIDDYTFFCDSYDVAQRFLRRLEEELSIFKLRLNPRKTSIRQSITPFHDEWTVELSLRMPSNAILNSYQAINYLEFASSLAVRNPEGSVFKYAVLDYLLVVAMQYPVLLPTLDELMVNTSGFDGSIRHNDRLTVLPKENALLRRSDGMAWSLFYIARHRVNLPVALAQSVIDTKDCISILMLYLTNQHEQLILDWVSKLEKSNCYELDQYWLLLYQLYIDGKVNSDMCSVPASFEALKSAGVTFITQKPLNISDAHKLSPASSFKEWLA